RSERRPLEERRYRGRNEIREGTPGGRFRSHGGREHRVRESGRRHPRAGAVDQRRDGGGDRDGARYPSRRGRIVPVGHTLRPHPPCSRRRWGAVAMHRRATVVVFVALVPFLLGLARRTGVGGLEDVEVRAPSASLHGTLYFSAEDATHGRELWLSDGTDAGTILVEDIRPGTDGSHPHSLAHVGETLYFIANDGEHGDERWQSDGTEAGTSMVKDIAPGRPYCSRSRSLTPFRGHLYFTADDGTHGCELWKTDGPSAGTVMVKDIGGRYG